MTYSKQVCEGGAIEAAGDILKMALRTADDAFSSCASTLQHRSAGEGCSHSGQRAGGTYKSEAVTLVAGHINSVG